MNHPENDFPGMPDSGVALMRAAQRQVRELQEEVREGRRQAKWTKIQVRVLGALAIVLLIVVGVLGASISRQDDLYNRLHQQQLNSCEFANTQRQADEEVWDSFIDLLTKDSKDPKDIEEGKQFKQFIAQVDAPRNCKAIYSAALDFGN